MKRIEEQARRLDQEYQGIAQLFDQFCQQAGVLAERYHFFNWPDYEGRPRPRLHPAGEPRELRLRCQPGEGFPERPPPGVWRGKARFTPAWAFMPTATCCWSRAACSTTRRDCC